MVVDKIVIYGLYHPITKDLRYVGKTIQGIGRRLSEHLRDCKVKKDTYLFRWIRKLLNEDLRPEIAILEVVQDINYLDEAEKRWIKYYKENGAKLTNLTEGGTGGATRKGQKNSQEHIQKVTEALRKYYLTHERYKHVWTEEEKKQQSERRLGMKFSEDHRKNLSKAKTGIVLILSDEQRLAISERNKGKFPERGPTISKAKKGIYTEAMKRQVENLRGLQRKMTPEQRRPTAKFTNEQVYEIRKLLAEGRSLNSLSREFNVSKKCILLIKQNKTYKDIKYE